MSASTEKKNRNYARQAGTDKKMLAAQEEAKKKAVSKRRWTWGTVGVVLLIAAILLLNSGLMFTATTALTANGTKYSPAQVNYYYGSNYQNFANQYGSYASVFGLDTSMGLSGLGDQECPMMENGTWRDYFRDAAKSEVQQLRALLNYAAENGIALSEEETAEVDAQFEGMDELAKSYGYGSADKLYAMNYGSGVNTKIVRQAALDGKLAQKAYDVYLESLNWTEDELEEYYAGLNGDSDLFTYDYYDVSAETVENTVVADDGTESVELIATDASREEAKATAEAIVEAYLNGDTTVAGVPEVAAAEDAEATEETEAVIEEITADTETEAVITEIAADTETEAVIEEITADTETEAVITEIAADTETEAETAEVAADAETEAEVGTAEEADDNSAQARFAAAVDAKTGGVGQEPAHRSEYRGSYLPEAYADWLKDPARAEGDVAVFADSDENPSAYTAVVFLSRNDNHYVTANVRHILVKAEADEDGNYSDEAKAAAKARAEEILAEFEAGEQTEERFAALANEYSEDTGSNTNGGLYENVYRGQMVEEFENFCFDDHQPGDTGIVYGESSSYAGYHVMYYVGEGELYSSSIARTDLENEAMSSWLGELTDACTVTEGFGFRFVGK